MLDEIFVLGLAALTGLLFNWAFRTLPQEDWQVLACLPGSKGADGRWRGVNLTYYGFFNASAYVFAVLVFLILIGSLGVPWLYAVAAVLPVLIVGMWAARFVARVVEKKPSTLSVGAASFACILTAPWIIVLTNRTLGRLAGVEMPMLETVAAMMVAYAFGEGIGRLACISFGCCYGKPLDECHPLIQKIFRHCHFIFRGKTKKITYADGLEGRAVAPVQALTAVLYTGVGLLSFYLFVKGRAGAALILSLLVTQNWRFASEFLRADHRGQGKISAYQFMTLAAQIYALLMVSLYWGADCPAPHLEAGLSALWHPGLMLLLAVLWLVAFLFTGKSEVTCSTIDIEIVEKKI